MKTYTIGDLKTNFSQILEWVRSGEEVAIAFGKKKRSLLTSCRVLLALERSASSGY